MIFKKYPIVGKKEEKDKNGVENLETSFENIKCHMYSSSVFYNYYLHNNDRK